MKRSGALNLLSSDKLGFGLFIAAAVHALVVFGVTFEWRGGSQAGPTLDVTIVSHRAETPPEDTDFIAQADQQASGTSEDASVPTTDRFSQWQGDESGQFRTADSRAGAAQEQARDELVQRDSDIALVDVDQWGDDRVDQTASNEASALLARLDALRQDLARRPRIGTLTSVAARAREDAAYQVLLQERIVLTGNRHYPQEALTRQIYGSLRLQLVILADGRLESAEILQSSGEPLLDRAAVDIARLAGPFDAFPPEMQAKYDKVHFIRTWQFLPGGTLSSL